MHHTDPVRSTVPLPLNTKHSHQSADNDNLPVPDEAPHSRTIEGTSVLPVTVRSIAPIVSAANVFDRTAVCERTMTPRAQVLKEFPRIRESGSG